MAEALPATADLPIVVLGAGYAGLRVAHEVSRRGRGRLPVVVIDRHPVHVLRTELYEIDALASESADSRRWLVPLSTALNARNVQYVEGLVDRIDLKDRTVHFGPGSQRFSQLAICLGSVPAFFGVPGAREIAHQVYGYLGARRLAQTLRSMIAERAASPTAPPVRVAVIGGGSTGTEVAAEIATARWARIAGPGARAPQVTLITGEVEFLTGFNGGIVAHARALLERAHVTLVERVNVKAIGETELELMNGQHVVYDLVVWAGGVQAPPVVRSVDAEHGHSGRLRVDPHLELPGHAGVFAVGDAGEFVDPSSGVIAPATAQAALAEAPFGAANLVARALGHPLTPFVYREKGVIVAVGLGKAAGRTAGVTIWGRPASAVKKFVEKGYAYATETGQTPRGL
jgi:NADH dehydrogenase